MSSKRKPSISAFFPAYNDAGTIAQLVIAMKSVLESLTDDFEIIVVDDGSVDQTGQILDRLAESHACLRVIHHTVNRGYGGALRTGFANATKDLIFYTDGDGQYDVHEFHQVYRLLSDGVDLVQGYKTNRSDSWIRKIVGRMYHQTVKILFQLKVRDVDCDFRLMRRSIFEYVELSHDSGVICVELVKQIQDQGFTIVETGVSHYPRMYGQSQFFRIRPLVHTLKELAGLWTDLMILRRYNHMLGSKSDARKTSQA